MVLAVLRRLVGDAKKGYRASKSGPGGGANSLGEAAGAMRKGVGQTVGSIISFPGSVITTVTGGAIAGGGATIVGLVGLYLLLRFVGVM